MTAVIFCVLAAAGCISSSQSNETITGNASHTLIPSDTPATVGSLPTTSPAQCHQSNTSLTLIRGDPFSYTGAIPFGNPSEIRVWVFGQNSSAVSTVPVQQDRSFHFNLTREQTFAMSGEAYRILFEIPLSGSSYGIRIASVGKENDTILYDPQGIRILDLEDLLDNQISGPVAVATLERAIQKIGMENVTGITLTLKDPEIAFSPLPDHILGDNVTINGTTNLHPGEMLDLQISEGYLHPCAKCSEIVNDSVSACCGYGVQRQVPVMPGMCGINTWSVDVDTSRHDFVAGRTYVVFMYGRNGSAFNGSMFTLAAPQVT
jgi:hypothetical protein